MKYSVGYQFDEDLIETIHHFKDNVSEVYFPWTNQATGRGSLVSRRGYTDWHGQQMLVDDLKGFKENGIKLNLLLNGSCYGKYAVSTYLQNSIYSILEYLTDCNAAVDVVTTASPAIAYMVKGYDASIDLRASVNMRIGTVKAVEYIADLFDSFYIQREYNRDLAYIRELKEYALGKRLYILANSGCMSFCSGQTFHDNAVAHGEEIEECANIDFPSYICWRYLEDEEKRHRVLQNTWIRPEDIWHYEGLVDTIKLATRNHERPAMVLSAYVSGRHYGNLLDLFEPGYGPVFAPYILDNSRFPHDWFEKTSRCGGKCHKCGYCMEVYKKILINTEELYCRGGEIYESE